MGQMLCRHRHIIGIVEGLTKQAMRKVSDYYNNVCLFHPRGCKSHYEEVEATLPKMFVWLVQLFSFILNVQPSCVYEEVLKVERRFLPKVPN